MKEIFKSIANQNAVLYYAGLACLLATGGCILASFFDPKLVLGINAWIKPIKFFISIWIFTWTMAFYLSLLPGKRSTAIRWYSIMVVIVFFIEMVIITGQVSIGNLSHFNVSTPFNGMLFSLMGIAIVTLTFWTAVASTWFWRASTPVGFNNGFWWGIRLGLILFVIFSFEGMIMATRLQHTVGAPDGGEGLPLVNWSRQHGDLRVAHFVGLHALQVLPLLGYFLLKKPGKILIAAILYAGFAVWLFLQAMEGKGLYFFSS